MCRWRRADRVGRAHPPTQRELTAVTPDALVPQHHPIRRIMPMVDQALTKLSPTFDRMYAGNGRASIPPEHLLKACLLMALFSVRSERQFCERLEYDLLFKWFLDLNIMDHSFDHSVFAKNRQRLLDADVAREFLLQIAEQARKQRLLSEEHFSLTLDQSRDAVGGLGIGEEFPTQKRRPMAAV